MTDTTPDRAVAIHGDSFCRARKSCSSLRCRRPNDDDRGSTPCFSVHTIMYMASSNLRLYLIHSKLRGSPARQS
jgi:hypothetical protein